MVWGLWTLGNSRMVVYGNTEITRKAREKSRLEIPYLLLWLLYLAL